MSSLATALETRRFYEKLRKNFNSRPMWKLKSKIEQYTQKIPSNEKIELEMGSLDAFDYVVMVISMNPFLINYLNCLKRFM